MASWFGSLSTALDTVTQTIRFQEAMLKSSARYYKAKDQKHIQLFQRAVGVQQENRDLRRVNEGLQREVAHLKAQLSGSETNSNGKRRRIDSAGTTPTIVDVSMQSRNYEQYGDHTPSQSTSSPHFMRDTSTPIIPTRLSLPVQFRHPQELSVPQPQRPGVSLGQFAYAPPETPKPNNHLFAPSRAPHGQRSDTFDSPMTTMSQRVMPPPPPPNRTQQFRPTASSTPQRPSTYASRQQTFLPPQPIAKASGFRPAKVLSSTSTGESHPAASIQQARGRPASTVGVPQYQDTSHSRFAAQPNYNQASDGQFPCHAAPAPNRSSSTMPAFRSTPSSNRQPFAPTRKSFGK